MKQLPPSPHLSLQWQAWLLHLLSSSQTYLHFQGRAVSLSNLGLYPYVDKMPLVCARATSYCLIFAVLVLWTMTKPHLFALFLGNTNVKSIGKSHKVEVESTTGKWNLFNGTKKASSISSFMIWKHCFRSDSNRQTSCTFLGTLQQARGDGCWNPGPWELAGDPQVFALLEGKMKWMFP